MTDFPTPGYLASIAKVMLKYGMYSIRVGDVEMTRDSTGPVTVPDRQSVAPASPAPWVHDGEAKFAETPAKKGPHEGIDMEAVDNDPRFQAFDKFGVEPSSR